MFYANTRDTFTYPDGAIGYRTPGPFSTWARWRNVLCEDGKRRAVYATSYADTFFSIPARVTVRRNGKRLTVSGFISLDSATESPRFIAYSYGRNASALSS